MATEEIVLPITKPETEWVRGRALRKMSPTRNHARLQSKFTIALDAWASGRGEVGTEWRFRVAAPGGARRPFVPDIAFVAAEKLHGLSDEDHSGAGLSTDRRGRSFIAGRPSSRRGRAKSTSI